jgi:hypothetical protein
MVIERGLTREEGGEAEQDGAQHSYHPQPPVASAGARSLNAAAQPGVQFVRCNACRALRHPAQQQQARVLDTRGTRGQLRRCDRSQRREGRSPS